LIASHLASLKFIKTRVYRAFINMVTKEEVPETPDPVEKGFATLSTLRYVQPEKKK
jgi:hypothetical protein